MHRQAGTVFLFTYAKIPHVCVRTYPLQIQNLRYGSSILYASQPLAQLPRRGPFPKLLWADLLLLLLGRVALGARRPIVVKLSRGRSVGPYVRACVRAYVGLSSALWKTADRIRMPFGIIGRTGPGIRQVVEFGDRSTERGTFGGRIWGAPLAIVTNGDFMAYVCDSAATRPSSQITLGRLVSTVNIPIVTVLTSVVIKNQKI